MILFKKINMWSVDFQKMFTIRYSFTLLVFYLNDEKVYQIFESVLRFNFMNYVKVILCVNYNTNTLQ